MDIPELTIVSKSKLSLDRDKIYKQRVDYKPDGLWIGIRDNWVNYWYIDEEADTIHGKYLYEVLLEPDCYTDIKRYRSGKYEKKIFVVKSKEDVDYMNSEYGSTLIDKEDNFEYKIIKWNKFAERYGGIRIENYINDRGFKLDNIWYSMFDIDSICVWNLHLVKKLNFVKQFSEKSKSCISQ